MQKWLATCLSNYWLGGQYAQFFKQFGAKIFLWEVDGENACYNAML